MKLRHLIISLALALGSTFSAAEPLSQDVTDLKPVGLAVMVLNDDAASIESGNPVYQWIIGRLQKKFKHADFMVFNAAVPSDQRPDSSLGLTAVKETLLLIDNPHVNTVVLVNARVSPESNDDSSAVTLSLSLRLFNVETESVFRELKVNSSLQLERHCDRDCQNHTISRSLLALSRSLTPETVASIQAEYSLPDQMIEQQLVARIP